MSENKKRFFKFRPPHPQGRSTTGDLFGETYFASGADTQAAAEELVRDQPRLKGVPLAVWYRAGVESGEFIGWLKVD